ncbi:MAG: ABC transporter ATP-binding protein [Lachnospiraceae bacterium]|nr:ABC transporter ATP-binding protein [Lachnospiraceae bacterium]
MLYDTYMAQSGWKKQTFEGVNTAVDFLMKYGTYLCVLGTGAFIASQGVLRAGTVLTGYLSLSSIGKCYTYGVRLIEQRKSAKEYMSRIVVFYGESEENVETSIQKMSVQKMSGQKEMNAHKEMISLKERNAHKEMIPQKEPEKDCVTELHVEKLTFSYDKSYHPVIRDFSMTLRYGDCVEIMGANGCGKSTLLNLLCGLYRPDEGSIRNQAGDDLSAAGLRKAVTIQEQNGAIFSGTIFENLFLPFERYQEAEEMRLEFGLEKSLDYVTETEGQNLSPGERKKILLIRALLAPSEFCLLDEPLNHLDEKGRQALTSRLLRDKRGFVIVSHQDILPTWGEIRRYLMR